MPHEEYRDLSLHTAIEARLAGLVEQVRATNNKLDAVHLSLGNDISDLKDTVNSQNGRIGRNELRMARMQGAIAALAFLSPFAAIGLQALIGG